MARKTGRESGMTLMEILIALLVMGLGLMGLALAFPPAGVAVHEGREFTHAAALAEQRMELARRTPYSSLPSLGGTDSTTYSPYTVITAVTPDAPAANLTTVNVTVQGPYLTGGSGPQNVVVESFFSAS